MNGNSLAADYLQRDIDRQVYLAWLDRSEKSLRDRDEFPEFLKEKPTESRASMKKRLLESI